MNKIHVVIGEQDEQFLIYLVDMMENGFSDYIEAHCFAKPELFLKYRGKHGGDVFLIDEKFGVEASALEGDNCGYFCEQDQAGIHKGFKAIGKYQTPDEIYEAIMDIHANGGAVAQETEPEPETVEQETAPCQVILVQSFSGGTGVSTYAAASAIYSASKGTRTFYLNLEDICSTENFFQSAGRESMDDVLAALREGRDNLADFAADHAQTDPATGVSFFAPCKNALSMAALGVQEWMAIVEAVKNSGSYELIYADCSFGLDDRHLALMEEADKIVTVTDGGETANTKFYGGMEALAAIEQQNSSGLKDKMVLLYNRFSSSKSSSRLETDLPVVGTFPPVKHALVSEIIQIMLERQNIFERMLKL